MFILSQFHIAGNKALGRKSSVENQIQTVLKILPIQEVERERKEEKKKNLLRKVVQILERNQKVKTSLTVILL